ncbi:MAG: creatininase family protein [Acidobacteriota bacterium]
MMNKIRWGILLSLLFLSFAAAPLPAQQSVADLKYVEMGHYSWIKLASIVPNVTDRVILPVGTIEPHGATCIGSDTYIPVNLAQLAARKCNALVAPAIAHGATGLNIAGHPGAIRVRPEILTEYIVDVLEGLVGTGFRNIFILNGHGGNTESIEKAADRIFERYPSRVRIMVSDWWTIPKAEELSAKAFSLPKHDIGAHGGLEEAALNQSINPDLFDWEVFESLGPSKVANVFEEGFRLLPAPYTMGYYGHYPTKDIEAARRFTQMIADYYAETFNKAVEAWDFLEKRDKCVK